VLDFSYNDGISVRLDSLTGSAKSSACDTFLTSSPGAAGDAPNVALCRKLVEEVLETLDAK